MIFDDWPTGKKKKHRPGLCTRLCCSCACCSKKDDDKDKAAKAARLFFDLTVLPQEEADGEPVVDNEAVTAPKGRLTWKTAIQDPPKFFKTLVGPTNERRLKKGLCFLCCFIFIVAVLAAFF